MDFSDGNIRVVLPPLQNLVFDIAFVFSRERLGFPSSGFPGREPTSGGVSSGLASVIEHAVSKWGLPNGYVLGEEAGGAFFGGLRYGEGMLYTKNAGDLKVFWQGPSVGWDFGGEGARTMMLVYSLPATRRSTSDLAASADRPILSAASG
jgi:Envelope integrity protein A